MLKLVQVKQSHVFLKHVLNLGTMDTILQTIELTLVVRQILELHCANPSVSGGTWIINPTLHPGLI